MGRADLSVVGTAGRAGAASWAGWGGPWFVNGQPIQQRIAIYAST
jgi:hypothetical protein